MKKLLIYLKAYRKEACLAPIFKMLEAVFELFVPLVIKGIIDYGIAAEDRAYCLRMGLLLLLLAVIGLAMATTAQWFSARAAVGFAAKIKQVLMEHIQKLSYTELDTIGTSTLITRMTSDVNQVQTGTNLVLRLFLRSPFIVVGAMVMAFTINVKTALIFVVTVPLLALVIYGIMIVTIPLYKKVQKALDQVLVSTRENLAGIRVIRAFCTQKKEQEEFDTKSEILMKLQFLTGRISALLNPMTYIIVNAGIIAVVWYGGGQVYEGLLTQGEVIALVNYMSQILLALVALANLIVSFTKAVASAARLNEVFALRSELVDGEWEKAEAKAEAAKVKMEHVTFCYPGSQESALEDISFTAKAGETIGIIGGTGSGKTTLVNLIPRFYDVTEGKAEIDGLEISKYRTEALRKQIGVVPQKAVLFSGTIKSNLQMGNEQASEQEMYAALKTAQALEFVEEKPGRLNAPVSEGGKNLSGGQRQRLTIARALVKNPQILILDDSASALDFATDAALRKALSQDTENMTVFLVSQRASSVMHADKILVLDDGKMVGYGNHEELLGACGVYQEICRSQFSKEEGVQYA